MHKITVLVLKENFYGSHNSFATFYNALIASLNEFDLNVFYADNVNDAVNLIKNNNIDFSINIGQYNYFYEGKPLFDLFKVKHYQWIIDNPFKYNIINSPFCCLMFIDEEFSLLPLNDKNTNHINLPLGGRKIINYTGGKEDAIFVPFKLRTIKEIKDKIDQSKLKMEIYDFLDKFNYDESYVLQFNNYCNQNGIKDTHEFFSLTNSYLRQARRVKLINSLGNCKVIITGTPNEEITLPNVRYIGDIDFKKCNETAAKCKFVLNSNPNYFRCMHERVSYSVLNGSVVISDYNALLDELSFPLVYKWNEYENIHDALASIDYDKTLQIQQDIVSSFTMTKAVEAIVNNFLNEKEKTNEL